MLIATVIERVPTILRLILWFSLSLAAAYLWNEIVFDLRYVKSADAAWGVTERMPFSGSGEFWTGLQWVVTSATSVALAFLGALTKKLWLIYPVLVLALGMPFIAFQFERLIRGIFA